MEVASAAKDTSLLIVDDDAPLRERLGLAMSRRGYEPVLAEGVKDALRILDSAAPAYAIVDLRLNDGNGIIIVDALQDKRADCRAIMFTGYGNLPTAVAAVKAGAIDYLPKPVDADEIDRVLKVKPGAAPEPPELARSANDVRWTHIRDVYERNGRNISETARQLGMHRRTLQRILAKQNYK